MILVAGLGNPGPRYAQTRHNVGFMAVDRLAGQSASFSARFHGAWATLQLAGEACGLLKPQTFMNLSGRSVQAALAFTKVPLDRLIVIHDELDLPFGEVRLKLGGGHAGHNGLRSISGAIGPDYVRVRVGIGRPPADFRGMVADYVLDAFSASERTTLDGVVERAAAAVTDIVRLGLPGAMNVTNRKA